MGLLLGFDALFGRMGGTDGYILYLVNDSSDNVTVNFQFNLLDQRVSKGSDFIPANGHLRIGKMVADDLNDRPTLDVEAWRTTTAGHDKRFSRKVKVKAKQFFKNFYEIPVLRRDMHVFEVFPNLVGNEDSPITKSTPPKEKEKTTSNRVLVEKIPSLVLKSQFPNEIDLHITSLNPTGKKMHPADIFELQIQEFEKYIASAIQIGMDKVYVIHGIGKGNLRRKIHELLALNSLVKHYKNEHHPKYGFGATEITL